LFLRSSRIALGVSEWLAKEFRPVEARMAEALPARSPFLGATYLALRPAPIFSMAFSKLTYLPTAYPAW